MPSETLDVSVCKMAPRRVGGGEAEETLTCSDRITIFALGV